MDIPEFFDFSVNEETSYGILEKLRILKNKYLPLIDKHYPNNKKNSWYDDDLEAKHLTNEEHLISSFYQTGPTEEVHLSRDEEVKNLIEKIDVRNVTLRIGNRDVNFFFQEYFDADLSNAKHENDYYEVNDPKNLLEFTVKLIKDNSNEKILIVSMHDDFSKGIRTHLKSYNLDIGIEPFDLENQDIVICSASTLARYHSSFSIPAYIVNLDVCLDVCLFLNRLFLYRSSEIKNKPIILHVGTGIVKFMKEIFEK